MEDLASKVDEIRTSAARFYAVDLHLHSPFSHDWDNSEREGSERDPHLDRIPLGSPIPDAAIDAYRESIAASCRDLVAVTDHNVTSFGERTASKNSSLGLTVLPGVELCVTLSDAPLIRDLRIHVLAVFPEETHSEAMARILPAGTSAEAARDPRAAMPYSSVDELIDLVHQERGLAIAAHVEAENGLRGVYKNTTELLLEPVDGTPEAQQLLRRLGDQVKDELVKFDAIQVKPTTDAIHYKGPNGDLRVPLIVASDTHSGSELSVGRPGKYSFVKMSSPSFSGLRDALKYPDLRVRFETGLPEARPPRLLGLRLFGGKTTTNTFFDDTILAFSDNLTCIVGPRGSGKSAAIDALRYLMGYTREESLQQIEKVAAQVTDRQRHTLEQTRIEAMYQAADERLYRLVATYDPQERYVTEVYDLDGQKLNIQDVESCGEFPLRLFGWGELELLAGNPETQRELLDRFIPAVLALKEAKSNCYGRLVDSRRACIDEARSLGEYFTDSELDFRRLNEFEGKFAELNTPEMERLFGQLDAVKAKREILSSITGKLQIRLDEGDVARALGLSKLLEEVEVQEWADSLSARLKPDELDDWMRSTSQSHKARIDAAMGLVQAEDEKIARQEEAAEKEIQEAIGEDQAITGDLRNNAKVRYEKASANYKEYKRISGRLDRLLAERNTVLDEVADYENRIFAARNQEIESIRSKVSLVEDDHYRIGLVLEQRADRQVLQSALAAGALSFAGQWRAGKRPEILASNLTPRALADALLNNDTDAIRGLSTRIDDTDYAYRPTDAERLVADNTPYQDIECLDTAQVDSEKLEKLLRIQEAPIDDAFFITLGDKPIQYCSPGQRCSAMLPVVTLTSQAPLVIDQPEDNLDNRLVSRALFKILAKLKETRQIILATHNPNILVSGDAEQVLLLDAEGNLETHGSIDDPEIIDAVISLMEGGSEAFGRRHKKYEPYL